LTDEKIVPSRPVAMSRPRERIPMNNQYNYYD